MFLVLLLKIHPPLLFSWKKTTRGESDRLPPHVMLGAVVWRLVLPIWAPSRDPPWERSSPAERRRWDAFVLAHSFSSLIHVDLVIFFSFSTTEGERNCNSFTRNLFALTENGSCKVHFLQPEVRLNSLWRLWLGSNINCTQDKKAAGQMHLKETLAANTS